MPLLPSGTKGMRPGLPLDFSESLAAHEQKDCMFKSHGDHFVIPTLK